MTRPSTSCLLASLALLSFFPLARAEDDFLEGLKKDKDAISPPTPAPALSPPAALSSAPVADPAAPVPVGHPGGALPPPAPPFLTSKNYPSEDALFAPLGPRGATIRDEWNHFAFCWVAVQLDVKSGTMAALPIDAPKLRAEATKRLKRILAAVTPPPKDFLKHHDDSKLQFEALIPAVPPLVGANRVMVTAHYRNMVMHGGRLAQALESYFSNIDKNINGGGALLEMRSNMLDDCSAYIRNNMQSKK